MRTLLDLAKQPLDDIGSTDVLPMLLREAVKGETSVEIPFQTLDSGRVDLFVLGDEGRCFLIGFRSTGLVENGPQFWPHLLLLFLGNVAQNVVHLVLDTALALASGELQRYGIQHGLVAIGDPQVYGLHAPLLEVVQQVFPGVLVLPFAHREG